MGSPVPHTDLTVHGPVGDPVEADRRFRRFVLLDMAAAGAGVVVLVVVLAVVRTPIVWPLLVATILCVGLLAWSLRLYRDGRVDAAVLAVCATFWLQLVVAPLLVPSLFGGFAVLTVFPVLFAIPYVQRRTLLVISVATAVAAVVAVLLAVRAIVPVVSGLPTLLIQVVFVFVSVAFLGLGLTVLYAYSGRLGEVVDGLRHANAELHRSEVSLEQKVVERTAQLEGSREETARARDEAVGLSHQLAAVLENLAEGLLVIDPDGRVVRVNRRLEEMLARPSGSLLHQHGRRRSSGAGRDRLHAGPDPRDPAGRRASRTRRGQRHRRPGRGFLAWHRRPRARHHRRARGGPDEERLHLDRLPRAADPADVDPGVREDHRPAPRRAGLPGRPRPRRLPRAAR